MNNRRRSQRLSAAKQKRDPAFHFFPQLPAELRDAVWRECLPRRVVEIDIPLGLVALAVWLPGRDTEEAWDEDGRSAHGDRRGRGCYMEPTTRVNSAPPVITRVCRESRMVALETGRMLVHGHSRRCARGRSDIDPHVDRHWLDPARDVLHLHFPRYLESGMGVRVKGNPLGILHERSAAHRVPTSLTFNFISNRHIHMGWLGNMALLEDLGDISVCLKVVCIHMDEGPAIQSGLFGTLGEERVVLVDALDHERIGKYRSLWKAHRVKGDPLTEDFFTNFKNDHSEVLVTEARRISMTVGEAVMDLQAGWVLNRWRERYSTLRVKRDDVWYSVPAEKLPGTDIPARREHFPRLENPWVKEILPKFRPTIMFRLCTHACMEMLGAS